MKKILLSSLIALSILGTGCHKDEEFEAQKYGIQNTEVKGISFSNIGDTLVTALLADATPQTVKSIQVGLSSIDLPKSTVTYTVEFSNLRPVGTTALPSSAITFKTTNIVPAGTYNAPFEFAVTNASLLNSNLTYGLAFTITSADNGYNVAANKKTIYLKINIKNKYDGRYRLNGLHNRPPYNQFPYTNVLIDMYTSGPSSVRFYMPIAGFNSYGHPIGVAPGVIGWYGPTVSPNVTFNQTTNLVTDVNNADPAGPPISIYTGALSGVGRYDAATKIIYVYFRYNANDLRGFTDTLTYTGPRP